MGSMIGKTDGGPLVAFQALYPGKAHKLSLSSTPVTASFAADTTIVRVATDGGALFDIGLSPSTGNLHFLPASGVDYFACPAGSSILATQVSSGANLYVTEGAGTIGDQS